MTATLPRPLAVSEQDRLRREVDNLRAMAVALLNELVAQDVAHAANYSIHPYSAEQLADIAADSRERHTLTALAAINVKDMP